MIKRLQVVRVDNDLVQKADLQIGNNIISRGVVTGRNDDRVIKNAVTINVSPTGEMTITPYQVSPCYIKSTGSSRWELLKLGVTTHIKAGDVCSLLPDECWFKIISVPDTMEESNLPKRKAEEPLNNESLDKKPRVENHADTMSHGESLNGPLNRDSEDALECRNKECSSTPLEDIYCASSAEGDTMAPEGHDDPQELPEENVHVQQNLSTTNLDSNVNKIEEVRNMIEENVATETNDGNPSTVQQDNQPSASRLQTPTSTHVDPPRRDKCAYGKRCYRKNEQHKKQFSHPGDADYDIPDNRPECRYGVRCYRKNEQHRKDYKHTAIRPRRSKALTQPTTSDALYEDESAEESIDESDYDPTWISTSSDDDWDDTESDWDDDKSETNHKQKKMA